MSVCFCTGACRLPGGRCPARGYFPGLVPPPAPWLPGPGLPPPGPWNPPPQRPHLPTVPFHPRHPRRPEVEKILVTCAACDGSGLRGEELCPGCNGSGVQRV